MPGKNAGLGAQVLGLDSTCSPCNIKHRAVYESHATGVRLLGSEICYPFPGNCVILKLFNICI